MNLKTPPEEEPDDEDQAHELDETLTGMDYIPYTQRWAELAPEGEDDSDHTGVFTGFVLLSKEEWDKEQFIRGMKEKWDITVAEYDASEEKNDDALVFEVDDMLAAVSLMASPILGGEAEAHAENNYMWEDAVKMAKALIEYLGLRMHLFPLYEGR